MNTQLSLLSTHRRLSRAQFSPLLWRRFRSATARPVDRAPEAGADEFISLLKPARLQPVRAWHRGVLDRLSPELTRRHD